MKRIICFLSALVVLASGLPGQNNDFWMKFPGPSGGTLQQLIQTTDGIVYGHTSQYSPVLYRSADLGQHWSLVPVYRDGQPVNNYIDVGYSGTFNLLVLDSTLTYTTLYRSFDEGAHWTPVKDSLSFLSVFETPGGALLARTASRKDIWRSVDGGLNWTLVFNTNSVVTANLTIMPTGDLVFLSTTYETYRSWDDGQSWQIIGQTAAQVNQLTITLAGTLLVPNYSNMYRSTDNGLTWEIIILPGFIIRYITVLASGDLLALMSFSNGDLPALYRSTDDGQSWTAQPSSHMIWPVLLPSLLSDGSIFSYCNNALYRSTDEGLSWQFASGGIDAARVLQMDFVSTDTFFAMTPVGLWRTFDNGQQWVKLTEHTKDKSYNNTIDPFRRSFAAGHNGQIATLIEDSLYWSDDYGEHFTNITPTVGLVPKAIEINLDGSVLFANSTFPFHILRSLDHGQNWQTISGEELNFIQMEFHPTGRIYATMLVYNPGPMPTIWYSDDQGISWFPVNGIPAGIWFKDLHIDPSGIIYVTGEDPNNNRYLLYRSTDNGQSWIRHPVDNGLFYNGPIAGDAAGHLFFKSGSVQRSLDQGATWNVLPFTSGLNVLDPISPEQYLFMSNTGLYRTVNPTTRGAYIEGHIRRDADADCSTPDAQMPLKGWTVKATGANTFYGASDLSGHYLMFVDTGAYSMQIQAPNPFWWSRCEPAQDILLDSLLRYDTLDLSAAALVECPLMTVDLGIPALRRCFNNNIFVYYRNEGTETAYDAWVDVRLDPFTSFVSASQPAAYQGNDTYRFSVGNVPFGDGGHFSMVVYVECDSTVLGQTHCFSAHAYPDTLCAPVNGWSGAEIQATVSCQDTLVLLQLQNTGDATSQTLDYIIIIDDVVLMDGNRQYDPGESFVVEQPANGRTWRIQSEQEPGHPFSNLALAFTEGCGGFGSLGYINQFPVNGYRPSRGRTCVQNTGSYDPNDKQGFPLGYGTEHQVRPGQELEYLIRFQNTGTDTAFEVVIRDTLSPWLDPALLRPGAASHPYNWTLDGPGVLRFTFNNILLPDSNVNELASHGFVTFRVPQRPDVPLGAEIFNEAAIFFDFNAPVITNRTLHTVGDNYLVNTYMPPSAGRNDLVLASPNPASDRVLLRLANGAFNGHRITVTDARGMVVRQARVNGAQYLFQRGGLSAGVYFYRVEDAAGRVVGSGRFVMNG